MDLSECEKLRVVSPQSQKIGEFVDWLKDEKEIVFARYHEHSDEQCYSNSGSRDCGYRSGDLQPVYTNIENLLAEFFGIDMDKVERERRALLESLGEGNKA